MPPTRRLVGASSPARTLRVVVAGAPVRPVPSPRDPSPPSPRGRSSRECSWSASPPRNTCSHDPFGFSSVASAITSSSSSFATSSPAPQLTVRSRPSPAVPIMSPRPQVGERRRRPPLAGLDGAGPLDAVATAAAGHPVATGTALDAVTAAARLHAVVACLGVDRVGAARAADPVPPLVPRTLEARATAERARHATIKTTPAVTSLRILLLDSGYVWRTRSAGGSHASLVRPSGGSVALARLALTLVLAGRPSRPAHRRRGP